MRAEILVGDCRDLLPTLPEASVHCVVTSPPYFQLRDYGQPGQIGREGTVAEYVAALVDVFSEVWRVLHPSGIVWLNLGDTYSKQKQLLGIPWRVAFALQEAGWYLRQCNIWHKPNAMPSSVDDRTSTDHEYVFHLAKRPDYFYDAEAVKEDAVRAGDVQTFGGRKGRDYDPEPGDPNYRGGSDQWGRTVSVAEKRNKRSVWSIPTRSYRGSHFATFPPDLVVPMILAGTSEHGCCPDCLAPWERVLEDGEPVDMGNGNGARTIEGSATDRKLPKAVGGFGKTSTFSTGLVATKVTVGWAPSCGCFPIEPPIPCTVLDPFGGSGTVGEVSTRLNRRSILIELNPDYALQGERRNAQFGLGV